LRKCEESVKTEPDTAANTASLVMITFPVSFAWPPEFGDVFEALLILPTFFSPIRLERASSDAVAVLVMDITLNRGDADREATHTSAVRTPTLRWSYRDSGWMRYRMCTGRYGEWGPARRTRV
jgi:hypothetical protein